MYFYSSNLNFPIHCDKNYYVNKYFDFGIDIIHVSSFLTFKRFNTIFCFLFQFTIFLCRPKYI